LFARQLLSKESRWGIKEHPIDQKNSIANDFKEGKAEGLAGLV
jgi:hypothetical protein